jgi:diguanylate cyclase (GGDEF)-like protein
MFGAGLDVSALVDPNVLLLGGLILLASAVSCFFIGRRLGVGAGRREVANRMAAQVEPIEEDAREFRKSVWLLQNENKNLSTFLMLLPDLARELNNTHEKRKIAPLLRRMLEQIFDPEQILVFYTSQRNDGLILVEEKGLALGFDRNRFIPFGEGRVGWVASNQISMDESDFQQKARFVKADFDRASEPHMKIELAAAMTHNESTLGLLSVGGMLRHPKNEKAMLKMVADLGSIALNNALLFHKMQQLANSDGLTQLYAKRYFMAQLAEILMRAEKGHEEFAIFIFDIDHFKHYNDNNGHPAGDEALRTTGRILRDSVREDDLAARYGGEEFIVLLPNTSKPGAAVVAEKIRAAIAAHEFPKEQSQPGGDLTISGGVASYPYDGRTSAELIGKADEALYKSKRGGRNRITIYEPTYLSESDDPVDATLAGRRTA